jgi:hypothetical protein
MDRPARVDDALARHPAGTVRYHRAASAPRS